MKNPNEIIKPILATYIVCFGMASLVFLDLPETTNNSIVNIIIMVVSYHFGASSGSAKKDEAIQNMIEKK